MWHEQRSGPSLVLGWRAAQWDLLSVPVTSSSRPCPSSIYNSASSVRLALASPPVEKEQLPGPGERSIYKYGARKGWVRGGGSQERGAYLSQGETGSRWSPGLERSVTGE